MAILDESQTPTLDRLRTPAADRFLMAISQGVAREMLMALRAVGLSRSGPCPVATGAVGEVGDAPPAVFVSVGAEFAFHRLRLVESGALERRVKGCLGSVSGSIRSDAHRAPR